METAANFNEQKWTVRQEVDKKVARNGAFDTQSMKSTYSRAKSMVEQKIQNAKQAATLNYDTLNKMNEFKQQLEVEGLPSIIETKNDSRQETHKQTLNSKTQIFHNETNAGELSDPAQRKSLIDYPSYHNKSDAAQGKYKSFVDTASPRRHIPHNEDSSNSF